MLDGSVTSTTQSGRVFGTASYISPEGAAGVPTDPRSDVYSIAVLGYQLLCGELPFDGAAPGKLLMQHVHEPAPRFANQRQWRAGATVDCRRNHAVAK